MKKAFMALAVVAVLAGLSAAASFGLGKSVGAALGGGGNGITGAVTGSGDAILIPLSDISGTVKFYTFDSGGTAVRFIVVKAADGTIKTAFDACDVCYGQKKGYRQEGDYLVCNNCGRRFQISSLGTENRNPGGCWPGYLPSTVEGGSLKIAKTDLNAGRWRFA